MNVRRRQQQVVTGFEARKRPSGRRGTTLIELLVAIAMAAVLFSIIGTLMHLVLRFERQQRETFLASQTLARLADDFRQDVRAARTANVMHFDQAAAGTGDKTAAEEAEASSTESVGLHLQVGESTHVDYKISGGGVRRELYEGGDIAKREFYRLPRRLTVQFELHDNEQIRRPGMVIHEQELAKSDRLPPQQNGVTLRSWRIEAVLGMDLRFLQTGENTMP